MSTYPHICRICRRTYDDHMRSPGLRPLGASEPLPLCPTRNGFRFRGHNVRVLAHGRAPRIAQAKLETRAMVLSMLARSAPGEV